jgi:hypothetical protein
MAVVVLGNAVGLAANVAAAVRAAKAAAAASAASASFAANDIESAVAFRSSSQKEAQLVISTSSVQQFSEVAVLLLIVAAFVVSGVLCFRFVSSWLRAVNETSAAAATGRGLRRRMVGTAAIVFAAFVVRSVFATMSAVARQLQDGRTRCPGNFCDVSCDVFTNIHQWMTYTPEFQVTIVLISSPLTLLVALWGMTSRQILRLMKLHQQDITMTSPKLLR